MDINLLRGLVKKALDDCRVLLRDCKQRKLGFASVWDLETIISELVRIEQELASSTQPPKGKRSTIIGDIVVGRHPHSSGGWPYTERISEDLCRIADFYVRRV